MLCSKNNFTEFHHQIHVRLTSTAFNTNHATGLSIWCFTTAVFLTSRFPSARILLEYTRGLNPAELFMACGKGMLNGAAFGRIAVLQRSLRLYPPFLARICARLHPPPLPWPTWSALLRWLWWWWRSLRCWLAARCGLVSLYRSPHAQSRIDANTVRRYPHIASKYRDNFLRFFAPRNNLLGSENCAEMFPAKWRGVCTTGFDCSTAAPAVFAIAANANASARGCLGARRLPARQSIKVNGIVSVQSMWAVCGWRWRLRRSIIRRGVGCDAHLSLMGRKRKEVGAHAQSNHSLFRLCLCCVCRIATLTFGDLTIRRKCCGRKSGDTVTIEVAESVRFAFLAFRLTWLFVKWEHGCLFCRWHYIWNLKICMYENMYVQNIRIHVLSQIYIYSAGGHIIVSAFTFRCKWVLFVSGVFQWFNLFKYLGQSG